MKVAEQCSQLIISGTSGGVIEVGEKGTVGSVDVETHSPISVISMKLLVDSSIEVDEAERPVHEDEGSDTRERHDLYKLHGSVTFS